MKEMRPFLTAVWRYLAMLNYEVDPAVLRPHVPEGTVVDTWQGKAFVSMVGFLFLDTRVLGVAIPFHRNFEEVNLRFYVRQAGREDAPRAVAFVKEIVPRPAIAWTARLLYGEKYVHLPMQHQLEYRAGIPSLVEYRWRHRGRWQRLGVKPLGAAQPMAPGSEEEFIAEHYWGYASRRSGTVEYAVEHPRGGSGRSARAGWSATWLSSTDRSLRLSSACLRVRRFLPRARQSSFDRAGA